MNEERTIVSCEQSVYYMNELYNDLYDESFEKSDTLRALNGRFEIIQRILEGYYV
ncbi:hypothetical protein NVP2275O_341 [Vibrio phage 2.275.O._10N.286.54.E11]|nr:hypothetical protein NVP2275O_341 [Vibrio phage 2.275.O._10N.286.54.E11]